MMYICDILEGQVQEDRADSVAGDTGEGGTEQKLWTWDVERCEQIWAGLIRSGLLIDFDYATVLDQTFPVVPGDRTVSPSRSPISLCINFV